MKKFRKIWNAELNAWLIEHKDMNRKESYQLFVKEHPGLDISETAYNNQRSRVGAVEYHNHHKSTASRPLYSEQKKKGYIRIKVALPNVWMQKGKWVYMETHPWEDFTERSNYVFLDGDNRNFHPDNIERVPLSVMGIFNLMGGCEKGNPEVTRIRIAQAKFKRALLDKGEKMGLVKYYGSSRRFTEDVNRKAREYNSTPERKARNAQLARERRQRQKEENTK